MKPFQGFRIWWPDTQGSAFNPGLNDNKPFGLLR